MGCCIECRWAPAGNHACNLAACAQHAPLPPPAPAAAISLPAAAVQSTLSFSLNGMVFFFAGASAVNFMVR